VKGEGPGGDEAEGGSDGTEEAEAGMVVEVIGQLSEDEAEEEAADEAAEVRDGIGGRVETEEDEEQDTGGDAASDVGEIEWSRVVVVPWCDGEEAEGAHDDAGCAEALVIGRVKGEGGEVSDGAGGPGGEESGACAPASHGESEEDETETEVGGEVGEVGVERGGGEEAPPFSGEDGVVVHDSELTESGATGVAPGVEESEDEAPTGGAPMEEES
jgi:hypothetical protein